MVDLVDLESDCIDCDFLSECIGVVNDILLGIKVVVGMFVCISFEAVIISAITFFVSPCLLDIVYIVSWNSSCGALIVLYITDCLRKNGVSSDSFTS